MRRHEDCRERATLSNATPVPVSSQACLPVSTASASIACVAASSGLPDHQANKLRRICFGDGEALDSPSIPEHSYPIAQLEYFVQMVRNIDHRHPGGTHSADDFEQPPHFGRGERRCWFIEHEQEAGGRKSLGNFDELALRNPKML